jgi:1-aminocyclopropane-1-carboxylate deaminase/D-cysteine desulfhydrase-like pyridoxal-dependent ACC family enzyme
MSGNKLRKLEFLLADALARGSTHIVTIGAAQSNHVRATALACLGTGLKCAVILRVDDGAESSDPGLAGNLLLTRIAKP